MLSNIIVCVHVFKTDIRDLNKILLKTKDTIMEEKSFEVMYARLESISKEIQGENLTLDEVHVLYKEGISLSEKCIAHIDALKKEVENGKRQG